MYLITRTISSRSSFGLSFDLQSDCSTFDTNHGDTFPEKPNKLSSISSPAVWDLVARCSSFDPNTFFMVAISLSIVDSQTLRFDEISDRLCFSKSNRTICSWRGLKRGTMSSSSSGGATSLSKLELQFDPSTRWTIAREWNGSHSSTLFVVPDEPRESKCNWQMTHRIFLIDISTRQLSGCMLTSSYIGLFTERSNPQ